MQQIVFLFSAVQKSKFTAVLVCVWDETYFEQTTIACFSGSFSGCHARVEKGRGREVEGLLPSWDLPKTQSPAR